MFKLRKQLDVFHQEDLVMPPDTQLEKVIEEADGHNLPEDVKHEFEILGYYLPRVFPNEHVIEHTVAKHGLKNHIHSDYTPEYLPGHTRDNAWLVQYFSKILASNFEPINPEYLQRYVEKSAIFDGYREIYEQDLIKAQIKHQVKLSPNQILEPVQSNLRERELNRYDEFFRRQLVIDLTCIGLDQHRVELGLEKNAHLWRKQVMTTVFEHLHYPHHKMALVGLNQLDPQWKRLNEFKQVHQALWLRLREYAYYQNHHDVIDELGVATPSMKLKPREVNKLYRKLEKYNQYCAKTFADANAQINQAAVQSTRDELSQSK